MQKRSGQKCHVLKGLFKTHTGSLPLGSRLKDPTSIQGDEWGPLVLEPSVAILDQAVHRAQPWVPND